MSLFNMSEKAYLMLANGQVFEGRSFGAKGTVIGEVVFTTGLTGYQETLTDPSYYGQIVTQTFPLIGNYGVNSEDSESAKSYVSGYIVREWCNAPSNFRCEGNINDFLTEHNIIGIHGIDTRSLTRVIREAGSCKERDQFRDSHLRARGEEVPRCTVRLRLQEEYPPRACKPRL